MLRLFPLLLIPIVIYNFIALGGHVAGHDVQAMVTSTFSVKMFSGEEWKISFSDFLTFFALALLFIEVIKATRTTSKELINHGLSMLVFVGALVEFIVVPGFATSAFFFLVMFALFDVVAGYTISIVAAEHDLGLGRAGTD